MIRNPRAGARKSGGLRLEVFTARRAARDPPRHARGAGPHRRLRRRATRPSSSSQRPAPTSTAERRVVCLPAHLVERRRRTTRPRRSCSAAAHPTATWSSKTAAWALPTSARASRSSTPTRASCTSRASGRRRLHAPHRRPARDRRRRAPPGRPRRAASSTAALHNAEAIFSNTTKHATIGPLTGFCARKMIDMAAAIVGRPRGAAPAPHPVASSPAR